MKNLRVTKSSIDELFNKSEAKFGSLRSKNIFDVKRGFNVNEKPYNKKKENSVIYVSANYDSGNLNYIDDNPNNKVIRISKEDFFIILTGKKSGEIFTGIDGVISSQVGKISFKNKYFNSRYVIANLLLLKGNSLITPK